MSNGGLRSGSKIIDLNVQSFLQYLLCTITTITTTMITMTMITRTGIIAPMMTMILPSPTTGGGIDPGEVSSGEGPSGGVPPGEVVPVAIVSVFTGEDFVKSSVYHGLTLVKCICKKLTDCIATHPSHI